VGNSAWGVQFHPEVTEDIIRNWCAWDSSTSVKTEELITEFTKDGCVYDATARQLLQNFLRIAGLC
jgi:GMP synthase-like glutamine amidotransferase